MHDSRFQPYQLYSGGIDRATRFWVDALGFSKMGVFERTLPWVEKVTAVSGARIRVAKLSGYGHVMEFIEYENGKGELASAPANWPGTAHVCIDVVDIDATFEKLIAAGATPLGEMTVIEDPAMSPCAAGYLRDPNGIIIELFEKL